MELIPTTAEIKKFFPHIPVAFVRTFLGLLFCVITKSTVNLNKCKKALGKGLKQPELSTDAAYKRLIRFFAMSCASLFVLSISYLIFFLVGPLPSDTIYLAMDRSNWQLGNKFKLNINVLMLGIVLPNGCFVPLLWQNLNKKGNTNETERAAFLNLFIAHFTDYLPYHFGNKAFILLGDREFVGKKWFAALKKCMDFMIRVRKDDYLFEVAQSLGTTVAKVQEKIAKRVKRDDFFCCEVQLNGVSYQYWVFPNKNKKANDPFVRFVSTLTKLKVVADAYYKRWKIEVFFKQCKTGGFNLQDLNLKKDDQIMLLVAVVGCAYILALRAGIIEHNRNPIKEQCYANQDKKYGRKSIFTLGYEILESRIYSAFDLLKIIHKAIKKRKIINPDLLLSKHMSVIKS